MSRIGNKLIPIVEGLEVKINADNVEIKGKNGTDVVKYDPSRIKIEVEDNNIKVSRLNEEKHTKVEKKSRILLCAGAISYLQTVPPLS